MTTVKVGDVVAWADVPDGALVREVSGNFAMRVNGRGSTVGQSGHWCAWWGGWQWEGANLAGSVTIVALGLTGRESADELRRMAEVFEVREALGVAAIDRHLPVAGRWASLALELNAMAHTLHAAGWRPGMTAEDAARLLAAEEAR